MDKLKCNDAKKCICNGTGYIVVNDGTQARCEYHNASAIKERIGLEELKMRVWNVGSNGKR
jgi:hypothetical protein